MDDFTHTSIAAVLSKTAGRMRFVDLVDELELGLSNAGFLDCKQHWDNTDIAFLNMAKWDVAIAQVAPTHPMGPWIFILGVAPGAEQILDVGQAEYLKRALRELKRQVPYDAVLYRDLDQALDTALIDDISQQLEDIQDQVAARKAANGADRRDDDNDPQAFYQACMVAETGQWFEDILAEFQSATV